MPISSTKNTPTGKEIPNQLTLRGQRFSRASSSARPNSNRSSSGQKSTPPPKLARPAEASAETLAASLGEENPDALRVTQIDPSFRARLVSLVYTYRAVGHSEAWIDPLSLEPPTNPALDIEGFGFEQKDLEEEVATHFFAKGQPMKLNQMIGLLDQIYANKIGFEFMHINDREVRHWLRDKIEARPDAWDTPDDEKSQVLEWLQEAELFEAFLHKTYVAQKRFGLDGGESLMVALNGLFEASKENGVDEIVMGMAHRGRLNVLANFSAQAARHHFPRVHRKLRHRPRRR